MTPHSHSHSLATLAVKRAAPLDPELAPLSEPIVLSTIFEARDSRSLGESFRQRRADVYARIDHPTLRAAGEQIARMEGAPAGLVFSSGMAAITTALLAVLEPGDHVVAQRELFAQTGTFLERVLRGFGVRVDFVPASEPEAFEAALTEQTKLVYAETPSNPLLKVVDLERLARAVRANGSLLFVDGTSRRRPCSAPSSSARTSPCIRPASSSVGTRTCSPARRRARPS